ncbi:MAG: dTDP-glucose 4,6-dehydratase [Gemmatimonadaceae bacterium]
MSRRSFRHLLVTGGAGFIGSNFVRYALKRYPRLKVTVLDAFEYPARGDNLADLIGTERFELVDGSITDATKVNRLARRVDGIVNFAAKTHVDRSLVRPLEFVHTNVNGIAVLCEAARRQEHKAFLHVSTDEVYGDVAKGYSREDDALRPRSPYSASKAAAEMIANAYKSSFGVPVLVTRGSNTYGPYQFPEKLIPLLITNAMDGLSLPLYNDGSAVRDYIFVSDHCRALDRVLHFAPLGTVYNVATGVRTSGKNIAKRILEIMGLPISRIQYVRDRPGHDYRYAPDAKRLRSLGWEPKYDLDRGLRATIDWYQSNPGWWRPLKSRTYWKFYETNHRPLSKKPSG